MDKHFFDELRKEMDPLADAVVKQLMDQNLLESVNRSLFTLEKNSYDPENIPSPLKEFLAQTSKLPPWADQQKIRKAQELYQLYGLEISLLLFCKSLPQSYCCPKGVKVLHSTGRLSKDPSFHKFTRRVMETSQFVMNVLSANAFASEGAGIITIQKVRLLHASIRYYLKKYGWDSATLGEPINQEDMMGTLISFSGLVIEGLEKLNIEWTDQEKDAFIHCWNVAGYILGVKPELLPQNYQEAIEVGYTIFDHQKGYSEEGKELTDALVSFIHYILPGNVMDGMAENMIYYFLGKENAAFLGLNPEESFMQKKLPIICKVIGGMGDDLKDNSAMIRVVVKPLSRLILQGILMTYNDHKGATILIPPSLKENWELQTGWENCLSTPVFLGRRFAFQKKINRFD